MSENASQDQIKKAYRKLAKEYHPDTKGGDKNAEREGEFVNRNAYRRRNVEQDIDLSTKTHVGNKTQGRIVICQPRRMSVTKRKIG